MSHRRFSLHVKVGVPKESKPGERRVALVPDSVKKLVDAGFEEVELETACEVERVGSRYPVFLATATKPGPR